jgi:hypothetical protein
MAVIAVDCGAANLAVGRYESAVAGKAVEVVATPREEAR